MDYDFHAARSLEADLWMEPEDPPCAYCDDTGHEGRYPCPACNEENYVQALIQEDKEPDTEPAPKRLVEDLWPPY